MEIDNKRVFFGIEIAAPWPDKLPEGRILDEKDRHMTLAFLGNIDLNDLKLRLNDFPELNRDIGYTCSLDKLLFLPQKHPRVVAWHIDFKAEISEITDYQKNVDKWLRGYGYQTREYIHGFYPHTTVSRRPFKKEEWEKITKPLPAITSHIHLYESLGYSKYQSLWKRDILPPFEEIDHTADVAYLVRGESLNQIYLHASYALAFEFPELLTYVSERFDFEKLEDIIAGLNQLITQADRDIGCPFKAVSYHGTIKQKGHILIWEMIIDV